MRKPLFIQHAVATTFLITVLAADPVFANDQTNGFGGFTYFVKVKTWITSLFKKEEKAAVQTPVAQTPVAQAPVAQTPAAQAPVAQTPAAQAPVAQTPAAQTPVVQAPVAQTPVVQAPVVQAPAIDIPQVRSGEADGAAAGRWSFLSRFINMVVPVLRPKSQSQPVIELSNNGVRNTTLPAPLLNLVAKKQLLTVETLPPEIFSETNPVQSRKRIASRELPPEKPEISSSTQKQLKILSVITPIPEAVMQKISIITKEGFTLVSAMFHILWERYEDAMQTLHPISTKSGVAVLREKALTFEGYLLQEAGYKALAALTFAKAMEQIEVSNSEIPKYDNSIVTELSNLSRDSILPKVSVKASLLEKLAKAESIKSDGQSFIALALAEKAFDKGSYAAARKFAQTAPAKTTWKEHARYLAAASTFAQKDSKENLESAGRELTELFRTVENSDVFDATAVTLGRIHFILGNYKAAEKYLSQVSRETNMFIEAAVDNAWALLNLGDRNHAVGNMFTLHTPYFDGAYMPESFFLQSLGYQEICQFGDAMTSVKQYKLKYTDAFRKLIDFNAKGKTTEQAYYEDLAAYLGQKDHKLAGIVLRELGRHPEFVKRQKVLNAISKEERTVGEKFPSSGKQIVAYVTNTANEIRTSYKAEMNKFLKRRALAMEEELKFLTANISLLEYEIFAGAGNNLSLQGAQNFAVDEKNAPKRDFEEGKEYWPYEDEIWEDELNNFRSKIVDGCAKVKKTG